MDEMGMEHGDEADDLAMLQPLVDAVKYIAEQMQSMGERIERLEDGLFNQVIGGIENLYKGNLRSQGIEGLKAQYGERISPLEGLFSELSPDKGIYDHLYDAGEGLDEESAGSKREAMLAALQAKVDAIKSKLGGQGFTADSAPDVGGESPDAGIKAAIVEGSGPEAADIAKEVAGGDDISALANRVKALAGRGKK